LRGVPIPDTIARTSGRAEDDEGTWAGCSADLIVNANIGAVENLMPVAQCNS
jgi:hypothetical protein